MHVHVAAHDFPFWEGHQSINVFQVNHQDDQRAIVPHGMHAQAAQAQINQARAGQAGQENLGMPNPKLTSLGLLKWCGDPSFEFHRWHFLQYIKKWLTTEWVQIQGGGAHDTMKKIVDIFDVLELDRKARVDFVLLYQSGHPGRTMANKLMWELLSQCALDGEYMDLSNKVTSEVYKARRTFDRPPEGHPDVSWWNWDRMYDVDEDYRRWSPAEVPRGDYELHTDAGGMPRAPPRCWRPSRGA